MTFKQNDHVRATGADPKYPNGLKNGNIYLVLEDERDGLLNVQGLQKGFFAWRFELARRPQLIEHASQATIDARAARPQWRTEELPPTTPTVLGTQVGGSHYTDCAIQPISYIWANKLGFSEGNIVKYISRWKAKGGIKDLRKAHHHTALLIEEAEAEEKRTGVKYGL